MEGLGAYRSLVLALATRRRLGKVAQELGAAIIDVIQRDVRIETIAAQIAARDTQIAELQAA